MKFYGNDDESHYRLYAFILLWFIFCWCRCCFAFVVFHYFLFSSLALVSAWLGCVRVCSFFLYYLEFTVSNCGFRPHNPMQTIERLVLPPAQVTEGVSVWKITAHRMKCFTTKSKRITSLKLWINSNLDFFRFHFFLFPCVFVRCVLKSLCPFWMPSEKHTKLHCSYSHSLCTHTVLVRLARTDKLRNHFAIFFLRSFSKRSAQI